MPKIKSAFFLAGVLLVFSLASYAATTDLYNLNRRPFVRGGADSLEALRAALLKNAEDVRAGFTRAGLNELYEPFMTQLAEAEIEVEVFPAFDRRSGQEPMHVQWMMFRSSDGNIKLVEDLNWKVRRQEKVFRLNARHNCRDYQFIVPARCVNVALLGDKASPAVCKMSVSPEKVKFGESFTIDISGSVCVETLKLKISDAAGKVVKEAEMKAGQSTLAIALEESGNFTIEGIPYNSEGEQGDACSGQVYVNFPPICDLEVTPERGYVGRAFTLDASGSSDPDGEVVAAEFTVSDKRGTTLETLPKNEPPFKLEKVFSKSGRFNVSVRVTDDMGDFSQDCESGVEVEKRFYGLLEAGPMVVRGTYSGYLFSRFGFLYMIVPDSLDLVVSAGPALTLTGKPFKSFIMGNVLLNARLNNFFMGGGLAYTSAVKEFEYHERPDWSAGLNLVLQAGHEIMRWFNSRSSIFVEFQMPMHDSLKVSNYHMLLFGFRFLF